MFRAKNRSKAETALSRVKDGADNRAGVVGLSLCRLNTGPSLHALRLDTTFYPPRFHVVKSSLI